MTVYAARAKIHIRPNVWVRSQKDNSAYAGPSLVLRNQSITWYGSLHVELFEC